MAPTMLDTSSAVEAGGPAGSSRPLELLEREITGLAGRIQAATCRWLGLVEEFDRREGWADWGCGSCAQWLSHYCSIGPATAREQVRVAGRLAGLPAIRAVFARGELSYSQVRALSRVATPEIEEDLVELARHATAAQLERVLRAYRGVVRREASPADLAHGERYLVCQHDDDGTLLIRGRLAAEEGRWWWRRLRRAAPCSPANPRAGVEVFPRKRKRPPASPTRPTGLLRRPDRPATSMRCC